MSPKKTLFKQIALRFSPELTDEDFDLHYDSAKDVIHTMALTLKFMGGEVPAAWCDHSRDAYIKYVHEIVTTYPTILKTLQDRMPNFSATQLANRLALAVNANMPSKILISFFAIMVEDEEVLKEFVSVAEEVGKDIKVTTADLLDSDEMIEFLKECRVPEDSYYATLLEVFGDTPDTAITDHVAFLRKYREETLL